MKDEDIELISEVLGLMSNMPVTSIGSLLDHPAFKQQKVGSDRLGAAIAFLVGDKLIDEIPKTNTRPVLYHLSAEGNRVKSLPDGYRKFVEQKSVKVQQEMQRQSMAYELTALQISKVKKEIELQVTKQQNEFYQKSIEKLSNDLDEKARAIEKELKKTTIDRNNEQLELIKNQKRTIWIALILAAIAIVVSIFK